MEKIKAKRMVQRRQNTVIINEVTTALETADTEELAAILHRLDVSNEELQKLNEKMEDHISAEAFVDEYTEVTQYDDRTHRIIGLLQARIAAARVLLPSPQSATTTLEPVQSQPAGRPQRPALKMPKLWLETFGGELATWQSFRECFKDAMHENEGLSKTKI
ncbi:hypothetical protein HPB50_011767 [Hyalomma asiaticum]|uniref:Uncharacterized protein n=1 Tax=Hyalomma asiaticum TaxID=266040 RepID=A0ACB7TJB7_HYAAI|nr:hypothetical protein HPB50_011767 [Hyalomma asiaticum]